MCHPTRRVSTNARYLIRRPNVESRWRIVDRVTTKPVELEGTPITFIEAAEAEDWIALRGETGMRRSGE